jgi:hypothetical protein
LAVTFGSPKQKLLLISKRHLIVRKRNSKRASDVLPTQAEAIIDN